MNGGDLILMARRRAQLTQRELAGRLGCRQATIARWERGDRLPSYEDAQSAVAACELQLDVHLVTEDRSWWPQVAIQLGDDPVARVRRLTAGGPDAVAVLEALADTAASAIVIGELAGALHGWPLVLGGTVEVCARMHTMDATLERLGAREGTRDAYELSTGGQLIVTDVPPGTAGFGDLARGAEEVVIDAGSVQVAGLLDLLRIADASGDLDAARRALAYRAVLDVQRIRRQKRAADARSDEERIAAWLSRQTPVR